MANFTVTFTPPSDPTQGIDGATIVVTDGTGVTQPDVPWDGGMDAAGNWTQDFDCATPVGPDGTVGTVTAQYTNGAGPGPLADPPLVLAVTPPPPPPPPPLPPTISPTMLSIVQNSSGTRRFKGAALRSSKVTKRMVNGRMAFVAH